MERTILLKTGQSWSRISARFLSPPQHPFMASLPTSTGIRRSDWEDVNLVTPVRHQRLPHPQQRWTLTGRKAVLQQLCMECPRLQLPPFQPLFFLLINQSHRRASHSRGGQRSRSARIWENVIRSGGQVVSLGSRGIEPSCPESPAE